MPQQEGRNYLGRGGPLDGLSDDGRYYQFDYSDVEAKALRDFEGNIIGIAFSTRRGEYEKSMRWAAAPNRSSDEDVFTVTKSGDPKKPTVNLGEVKPAPWRTRPIYVFAHGTTEFFKIPVETDDGIVELNVVGPVFGAILRARPEFKEAARNAPGKDGLLMSCSTGHPNGSAAAEAARYMHDTGSTRTWHAPVGDGHVIISHDGVASGYGVSQTWDFRGNEIPGGSIVSFPPPPTTAQGSQSSAQAYGQRP